MLKTLWSGLTGLNATQKAIDVESNNIANANTDGFKYSKVSFEDLISQTYNTSTAPSESLGGINSTQIGLGVKISSIDKVFSQGALEQTDRTTDLAIEGNGFFVVTDDNGDTQNYTRNGQFKFDTNGTLVTNNGFKVMGWEADIDNFNINSSNRLETITIDPNMEIKAQATTSLEIKANLNNGEKINESVPANHPFSKYENFNNLYDNTDTKLALTNTDTITIAFFNAAGGTTNRQYTFTNEFSSMGDIIDLVNEELRDPTGEVNDNRVYLDGNGRLIDSKNLLDTITSSNTQLNNLFSSLGTSITSEPLKLEKNGIFFSNDVQELYTKGGEKINLENGQGITMSIEGLKEDRNFVYRSDDMTNFNSRNSLDGEYQDNKDLEVSNKNQGFHWTKNALGEPANLNVGDSVIIDYQDPNVPGTVIKTLTLQYGIHFSTMEELSLAVNDALPIGIDGALTVDEQTGQILKDTNFINDISVLSVLDAGGATVRPPNAANGLSRFGDMLDDLATTNSSQAFFKNNTYYFTDTQNLENLIQMSIDQSGDPLVNPNNNKADVSMNEKGQIEIDNTGSKTFGINVSGYPDALSENKDFSNIMMGLNALSIPNNTLSAGAMTAASHIVTTDVFDSSGISHAVDLNFVKSETLNDKGLIVWNWTADIGEPAELNGTKTGEITFEADGSLHSYTPSTLTFTSTGGAQGVPTTFNLDFGNVGDVNGIISRTGNSITKEIVQDGYKSGEIEGLTVDKFGVVNGVFSNGISKTLAQVSLAVFANDSGLESLGGNVYRASANSGIADISTANEPGVGSIQSNSLEKSNVDLSISLVNLIVFQRGFSSNSKVISTADELLKELIGLKR